MLIGKLNCVQTMCVTGFSDVHSWDIVFESSYFKQTYGRVNSTTFEIWYIKNSDPKILLSPHKKSSYLQES